MLITVASERTALREPLDANAAEQFQGIFRLEMYSEDVWQSGQCVSRRPT